MCHQKMNKTQLPQDFGLFHTFFTEDYIGSSEGKNVYMPPKKGQIQLPQDLGLFRTFFTKDFIGSSEAGGRFS